jgi:hypothetical protein
MSKSTRTREVGRQYEAAYAAHYETKDLHEALGLYEDVIAAHPDTREAEYSRSQLLNIINSVVPRQELLDAQIALALTHLENGEPPDDELAPEGPVEPEPPR